MPTCIKENHLIGKRNLIELSLTVLTLNDLFYHLNLLALAFTQFLHQPALEDLIDDFNVRPGLRLWMLVDESIEVDEERRIEVSHDLAFAHMSFNVSFSQFYPALTLEVWDQMVHAWDLAEELWLLRGGFK
jgi:hypothetical protein